jgi:hypothetical protein
MRSIRILLLVVLFASATGVQAQDTAPPEIARIQGGNTKTIWGVGFTAEVEVWGWNPEFDEDGVKTAIVVGSGAEAHASAAPPAYDPVALLPGEPPDGARRLRVLSRDERGLVMAVEFSGQYHAGGFYDARAGHQVVWVKNAAGFSKPRLVRSADPWFVYPENAGPGATVRIFGRTLDARLVALRSADRTTVAFAEITDRGRHPLYEASIRLPEELPPGEYGLYVHNGAGGSAGWGGPVPLVVSGPMASVEPRVFDVREFGARGNGIDDDTQALRTALAAAGEAGGGIVSLPPGRFAISATLWTPSGVTLQGSGATNSILCVRDDRPMRWNVPGPVAAEMPGHFRHRQADGNLGAMVWMRDHSTVADVGFEDGPGTLLAIFGSHDHCRILRCRLRMSHAAGHAICVEWGSHGFTVRDCDIVARGGLFLVHGPHTQAYIGGNTIRSLEPGLHNNLFVRAPVRSVIENNVIEDADRNFVSQLGRASSWHTAVIGNRWQNNIPRRHNAGENMYEAGGATWHGRVANATADSIAVEGEPFAELDLANHFVLVLDGRGIGQYRRLVRHTADTLTVQPRWDVVPDSETHVMAGRFYVEHLWIDNTEEHTANWTGFWGNNVGHVVDGHVLRDGSGYYLWGWNREVPSAVCFIDIIGSRATAGSVVRMIGSPVFGNTIRFSEVTGFRYRPSFHIQPVWLQGMDPKMRAAISIEGIHRHEGMPETAPVKHWNIIEATHVVDGPRGISISLEAGTTILRSNAIHVDSEALIDEAGRAVVIE